MSADKIPVNGTFDETTANDAVGATDHGTLSTAEAVEGWRVSRGQTEIQVEPDHHGNSRDETALRTSGAVLQLDNHAREPHGRRWYSAAGHASGSTVPQSFTIAEENTVFAT